MCLPAGILATIAIGTAAAGTLVSTIGAVQQGKAQRRQADFNAAVSRNNAVLAERQAEDSLRRGRIAERQKRLQISKLEGSQIAAFAANNVALDEGSPLDVLEFTAAQGELEASNIRVAAEREATGFRARAGGLRAEAGLLEASGKAAESAGFFEGFSSLLAGASQTANLATGFRTRGVI